MAKRALPKSGHLQAALRVLWHFCGEVKTFSITSSGFFNILCIGVQRKGSLRRRRKLFHQKTLDKGSLAACPQPVSLPLNYLTWWGYLG